VNRAAVYARYSSEKQNPLTISQQIRKCREYAERNGFVVLDEHVYSDDAISGATDNRAGLQLLLAATTRKPLPFDVLLVDDTSRLSRNMIDSLRIFERLRFAGVRTIFVAQGIDTTSEQAELLVTAHGMVDSLYLKDLRARTFRGVEQRAIEGLHTGGRVFGYKHVPIQKGIDSYGRPVIDGVRLVVDPQQAAIVRRIFESYAAGHSMKRIAIEMNHEGIPSPQPQKGRISQSWSQASVHYILHNERYRGIVNWGKTRKIRSAETGKRIYRPKPPDEWCRKELPEQRIIPDDLWEAVQARLRLVHRLYGSGANGGIRGGRAAGSPYLFTGLLQCALCGGSITIVSGSSRKRSGPRYGCSLHASRGSSVCDNNLLIDRQALETQLLSGLQSSVLRPECVEYIFKQFQREICKAAHARDAGRAEMEQRKLNLEKQIMNCANAIAEGQPSKFLLAKIAELERELADVTRTIESPEIVRSGIRDMRKFVEDRLRDVRSLLNSDPRVARAAISKHVRKITLTPEGRAFVACGEWDLLGADTLMLVPGAGFERNRPKIPFRFILAA